AQRKSKRERRDLRSRIVLMCLRWLYCLKRCSYCNFNKYILQNQNHAVMTECLQKETQTSLQLSQVSRSVSVFFGGGTPSLAQPSTIAAVLETVSKHTGLSDDAEVTLEVNPTPAGKARLKDFTAAGVNRFSIGVQSLNDGHLRILGRDHDSQHALWTVSEARTLFPGRVSVDVMFALPGQSVKSWETELKKLLLVCDDHVSLYQLTLERGMQLFKPVDSGELSVPGDNVTAVMYNSARGVLEKAGFRQYEVSNFAKNLILRKPTHSFTHKIYLVCIQYCLLGAHGRFVPLAVGGVQREARTQTLEPDVWMREHHGHGTRRRIQLDHGGLLEEVLVMGLRMNEGITQQHWELFSPEADLQQTFGELENVQELGLRCSWEGLALLDSILPTMLLELEMFFKKQYTSRKTDLQRDR
uniref:Radical S-adenosyl methionine domain-containing protein 1, mitochondrial-like n=1 Tax=Sinocyclocheilus anshuiensis TaxID=1608454 RepID=A0A671M428_9TELE